MKCNNVFTKLQLLCTIVLEITEWSPTVLVQGVSDNATLNDTMCSILNSLTVHKN